MEEDKSKGLNRRKPRFFVRSGPIFFFFLFSIYIYEAWTSTKNMWLSPVNR